MNNQFLLNKKNLFFVSFLLIVSLKIFSLPYDHLSARRLFFSQVNDFQKIPSSWNNRILTVSHYVSKISIEQTRENTIKTENKSDSFKVIRFFYHENTKDYFTYPGSFVFKIDMKINRIIELKIYYQNDKNTFFHFFNELDKIKLDIYHYGFRYQKNIPTTLTFNNLKTATLEKILNSVLKPVDWDYLLNIDGNPFYSIRLESFANTIKNQLCGKPFRKDGAPDEYGRFVMIKDQQIQRQGVYGYDHYGFVKAIADYIYKKRKNSNIGLRIEDLKIRHLNLRGQKLAEKFEYIRNPFFGLDWIRNIALKLSGKSVSMADYYDIINIPKIAQLDMYGYHVQDIFYIAYYLAKQNPGNVFFFSINQETGSKPVLKHFTHVGLLIPYFINKKLNVRIFTKNDEINIYDFIRQYYKDNIFFVRVNISDIIY